MDVVDRDIERAESEATRTWSQSSKEKHDVLRTASCDSGSSSSTNDFSELSPNHTVTALGGSISNIARARIACEHPIEIYRTQTNHLLQIYTVGASLHSRQTEKPLPEFGGGKPYPPPLPAQDEYVVEFDGKDDPLHPQNWPFSKKFRTGAVLAYTCLCSTFTSSIFSASTQTVAKVFGVSVEVATLSTSLYLLGYVFGPLIWGPFSELQGRKLPIWIGIFGFTLFNFACATAFNLQTVMLSRFFAGFFGSCPLAVVAAVFADMFDNTQRGTAIVVFSSMVFMGPMLGPFVGGFVQASYLGWRWNVYFPAIMGSTALILITFCVTESFPPTILVSKAAELRRRTKNWGIHAKQEEVEVDLNELITKNFSRPLRLLVTEPVILLVTLYMSFIYGLLYCFLTAYPLVFAGVHHIKPGVSGLPFFGMVAGIFVVAGFIIWDGKKYNKKLAANGGIPIPEWRLPPVMIGGALFSAGLFWFGWTGYSGSIPWIVPTLSGLFTGFGLLAIFICLFNYIIDSYLMFAASAIAANTFLRSIVGAGFPLFSRQLFDNLGIQWAGTLLGCLAAAMVPIPVCFYFFGAKLRQKSKFAPTMKNKPMPTGNSEAYPSDERGDNQHHFVALHASRSHAFDDSENRKSPAMA